VLAGAVRAGFAAGAVGEQTQLLLFDPVSLITAGTVGVVIVVIEGARVGLIGRPRGGHEARILSFGQVLGLDNDAACPCRVGKIGTARWDPLCRPTPPPAGPGAGDHGR
jgi:hypothetical protein